jgi:hypothetical protein
MAKSKKTKPIKIKKPRDPEAAARMRRVMIHSSAALALVVILAAVLFFDRRYVEHKLVIARTPPKVVLKDQPAWMSDFLADQIARVARPAGAHSAFDHQLLVDTTAVLRGNPWIREVKQVRRAFQNQPGDTIEIDCEYRAPVALVHWKDYYWLVDGDGVKLPEAFGEQFLSRIMFGQNQKVNIRVIEGVRQPPPESGARWTGEDLRAGLDLVKLLFGRPYAEEVQKVDVSNYARRLDPRGAQLVLVTKYNTRVRWGQPITNNPEDFFVEPTPAQKLKWMEAIVAEQNRIDANCAWVDLRFDEPYIPSIPAAQTAATEIQR